MSELKIIENAHLLPCKDKRKAATILGKMFLDCASPSGDKFSDALMESYIEKAVRLPERVLRDTVLFFSDGKHGSAFAPNPAEFFAKGDKLWTEEFARERRRQEDAKAKQEAQEAKERLEFKARKIEAEGKSSAHKPKLSKLTDTKAKIAKYASEATEDEKATAEYFKDEARQALIRSLEGRENTPKWDG